MDSTEIIHRTAEAFEQSLVYGKYNTVLVDDLKLLATWVEDIGPGKPGTRAIDVMETAIKQFGPTCDDLRDDLMEMLSSYELESLASWLGYTFSAEQFLLLDLVLWSARDRSK